MLDDLDEMKLVARLLCFRNVAEDCLNTTMMRLKNWRTTLHVLSLTDFSVANTYRVTLAVVAHPAWLHGPGISLSPEI